MSSKSSRPRVSGVSVDSTEQSSTGTSALSDLLSGLSEGARAAYRSLQEAREEMEQIDCEHRPLSAIREEQETQASETEPAQTQVDEDLSAVEATKVETLQEAAAYQVEDPDGLEAPMRALQQASTPKAARQAKSEVMATLETEHHRLFTQRLVGACTRASEKAGFPNVETETRPGGVVRVVATNEAGHALVSEVDASPDEEPSLATEVVGVRDGSCTEMLDAFDEALEEEGVRASTPRRTFTGGVCQLAAAKEFVQCKLRAGASAKTDDTQTESNTSDREDQRKRRQRRTRRQNRQR
jgi:hypothetical protein